MKKIALFLLVASFLMAGRAWAYGASDLQAGDKYYAEKSYQLAQAEYEKLLNGKGDSDALPREVTFKWSDCVVQGKDAAHQEQAQKNLQDLVAGKDHDRWWAEAGASLADVYIEKDPYGKAADIKKYLDDARDYWAGSSDVDLARERFITISFTLADFVTSHEGWYANDIRPIRLDEKAAVTPAPQGNQSLQILFEEVLKVAKSDEDKAHAHYGLAMTYMQNYSGDAKLKDKAVTEFKTVIGDFARSEWADDAWYQLGMSYENQSDFVHAAATYKDFLGHFSAGESKWVDDAKQRLEQIVKPVVSVSVGNVFVPGSEIQFDLNWRNIKNANITLYKFDMAKELGLIYQSNGEPNGYTSYQELLKNLVDTGHYKSLPQQLSWTVALDDDGKHVPHSDNKGMAEWRKDKGAEKADPKAGSLPAGAYLLLVSAEGVRARL